MVHCTACGVDVDPAGGRCPRCGAALSAVAPAPDAAMTAKEAEAGASWPPNPQIATSPEPVNDSGQRAGVPQEIAGFHWHWGAFGLYWLWMFNHGLVGLGLLALLFIGLNYTHVWPVGTVGGLILSIYVALNGHKLAWRCRRYEGGVDQFMKVEQAWHNWGIGMLAASLVGVPVILAAILFPVFSHARAEAVNATSRSNLNQVGLALMMYEEDYDEVFPPMDNYNHFKSVLIPYIKTDKVFSQPISAETAVPYALTDQAKKQSEKPLAAVDSPADLPLVQETVPHDNDEVYRMYADGHVHLGRR